MFHCTSSKFRSQADVSLARELIGYEPRVEIHDGIGRTVAWFRDRVTLAR